MNIYIKISHFKNEMIVNFFQRVLGIGTQNIFNHTNPYLTLIKMMLRFGHICAYI